MPGPCTAERIKERIKRIKRIKKAERIKRIRRIKRIKIYFLKNSISWDRTFDPGVKIAAYATAELSNAIDVLDAHTIDVILQHPALCQIALQATSKEMDAKQRPHAFARVGKEEVRTPIACAHQLHL